MAAVGIILEPGGATIMIAGDVPGKTSTRLLAFFQNVQQGQDNTAFRLLLVSVILAFLAVWWSEWFLRAKRK